MQLSAAALEKLLQTGRSLPGSAGVSTGGSKRSSSSSSTTVIIIIIIMLLAGAAIEGMATYW